MSVYRGYRVGDRVIHADPNETMSHWRGVVISVAFTSAGVPRHCRVEWTGTNDEGTAWVDDMGMEFFEIKLDPDFIDVPESLETSAVERWLAS
jgi:opacity protein-like surface antigen